MDETGTPLDPKAPLLVYECGTKQPSALGSGIKAQITVVACVNAAGMCIPPDGHTG